MPAAVDVTRRIYGATGTDGVAGAPDAYHPSVTGRDPTRGCVGSRRPGTWRKPWSQHTNSGELTSTRGARELLLGQKGVGGNANIPPSAPTSCADCASCRQCLLEVAWANRVIRAASRTKDALASAMGEPIRLISWLRCGNALAWALLPRRPKPPLHRTCWLPGRPWRYRVSYHRSTSPMIRQNAARVPPTSHACATQIPTGRAAQLYQIRATSAESDQISKSLARFELILANLWCSPEIGQIWSTSSASIGSKWPTLADMCQLRPNSAN